jgi:hypothetical protein
MLRILEIKTAAFAICKTGERGARPYNAIRNVFLIFKIRKEFPSIGGANIAHWKWAILGVVILIVVVVRRSLTGV